MSEKKNRFLHSIPIRPIPQRFFFPFLHYQGGHIPTEIKSPVLSPKFMPSEKRLFFKTLRKETCFLIFKNPCLQSRSCATAKLSVYSCLIKVRIKFPVFLCHGHPHHIIDLLNTDGHLPEKL